MKTIKMYWEDFLLHASATFIPIEFRCSRVIKLPHARPCIF